MARTRYLEDCDLDLIISGNNIDRVGVSRLLDVQITQAISNVTSVLVCCLSHVKECDERISMLLKSC